MANTQSSTQKLVLTAIMTALVFILQFISMNLRFSMFSITLTLIPIVLGSALCGTFAGAWLGFVFGVAVLLTGDAATFLAVNIPGTIITVLVKGTVSGLMAGLFYKLFAKTNRYLAVVSSAVISPITNTGVFLIGCKLFFMEKIIEWAGGGNVLTYMLVGFVGINFVIEFIINVVLTPVIVRLLDIRATRRSI